LVHTVLDAHAIALAQDLDHLGPGRDHIAEEHRLEELELLGEIDGAGPGRRVPMTAEISPAVQMPGAMGSLKMVVAP